jgi:hypothetical protein
MTINISAADLAVLEAGGQVPLQGPTPVAPVGPVESPDPTIIVWPSTAAITDAQGVLWTMTAGQQVAINGVTDTTTANVTKLLYTKKIVWQKNASDEFWGKSSSTAAWSPSAGTKTPPVAGA